MQYFANDNILLAFGQMMINDLNTTSASFKLTSVVGSYSFIVADAKWIENGRYVDVAKHAATAGAVI